MTGPKGRPPTQFFKVSATTFDGFKLSGMLMIGGIEAAQKARAVADGILTKTRRMFKERDMEDYTETNVEVLGAEHSTKCSRHNGSILRHRRFVKKWNLIFGAK